MFYVLNVIIHSFYEFTPYRNKKGGGGVKHPLSYGLRDACTYTS